MISKNIVIRIIQSSYYYSLDYEYSCHKGFFLLSINLANILSLYQLIV